MLAVLLNRARTRDSAFLAAMSTQVDACKKLQPLSSSFSCQSFPLQRLPAAKEHTFIMLNPVIRDQRTRSSTSPTNPRKGHLVSSGSYIDTLFYCEAYILGRRPVPISITVPSHRHSRNRDALRSAAPWSRVWTIFRFQTCSPFDRPLTTETSENFMKETSPIPPRHCA